MNKVIIPGINLSRPPITDLDIETSKEKLKVLANKTPV
jgi:hypothetical protein